MTQQTLVLATANPHKLKELRSLLVGFPVRVIPVTRFKKCPKVLEDGTTFEANAVKKASIYSKLSSFLTLADDSGLCVDSLKGRPGVYSARFAGPGCSFRDNNEKLLRLLNGKSKMNRKASFHCAIALYRKGRKVRLFKGICRGFISRSLAGRNGFGYDPVFIPAGKQKTFAQLSSTEKNKLSHRAKALETTKRFLSRYFS